MNGLQSRTADRRQLHERQILDQLETQPRVTQRSLASDLGIALGLTNLLIRRLVRKGWVRVKRVSARRITYLITPEGLAAKAELARQGFFDSLTFYRETRQHVRGRLAAVSADRQQSSSCHAQDVVFFGVGDVAEVAYLCLPEAGLQLVGVVDHAADRAFFQMTVHSPAALSEGTLDDRPFSRLIVMPLQDEAQVRQTLAVRRVPDDLVFWL